MKDTPRTDAIIVSDSGGSDFIADLITHGRRLEREINSALIEAKSWQSQADMHATDAAKYLKQVEELKKEISYMRVLLAINEENK